MPTSTENDAVLLASFPRKNRESGAPELIKVEASHYNGRIYANIRTWFKAKPKGQGDGTWLPTKAGVSLREGEIDAAIEALTAIKAMINQAGRATDEISALPPERPAIATPQRRPAQSYRPDQAHPRRESQRPTFTQPDDDDAPF